MSTTATHTRMSVVDSAGNVNVLYPTNTGSDVAISRANNTNIPSNVTNAQELANSFAASAFATEINDSAETLTSTWSSSKIKSELTSLNSVLETRINTAFSRVSRVPNHIISDNRGVISSPYGYTYDDLTQMLANNDWDKYIKHDDYMLLTLIDDNTYTMRFNIDTYYHYGDNGYEVPHHIDMISDEIIPGSLGKPMRTSDTNNGCYYKTVSNVVTLFQSDGTLEQSPYLASVEPGCMKAYLASYYSSNFPAELKQHVIAKRYIIPYRYSDTTKTTGTLIDDNDWHWRDLPYLFLLFEDEVAPVSSFNTRGFGTGGAHHYPIFNDGRRIIKYLNGSRCAWWLADARSGNRSHFCYVHGYGIFVNYAATGTWFGDPLAFRFV